MTVPIMYLRHADAPVLPCDGAIVTLDDNQGKILFFCDFPVYEGGPTSTALVTTSIQRVILTEIRLTPGTFKSVANLLSKQPRGEGEQSQAPPPRHEEMFR